MGIIELFILAVGLSMDAFAVSICKGLAMEKTNYAKAALVGIWFGGFQGLMPLIGYFLGMSFSKYIDRYDHWIAFILLALIGGNMIKESFSKEEEKVSGLITAKAMFPMAVATSIDAMAAGVAFSFTEPVLPIYISVLIIGAVTFIFSSLGVKIGSIFGNKFKSKSELAGGIILVFLGIRMLVMGL